TSAWKIDAGADQLSGDLATGAGMRLASRRSETRLAYGCALLSALALGCEGQIGGGAAAPAPAGAVAGGPGTSGEPLPMNGPSDDELRATDPLLFDVALGYFPGMSATAGAPRLFRLTRQQLDLTTESLLPGQQASLPSQNLPPDPLQTNYEYADNLSFSAASFTPLTNWASEVSTSVKSTASSLIDCSAEGNASACLERAARDFVTRAFRGVVDEARLSRFAMFYNASVSEVGIEQATADLVDVVLTSPGYLFRDEVHTDASGRLLPAQLLQNLSYTLADAPPAALGLALPTADARPLTDAEIASLVDRALLTPQARSKLLRFFVSWLEVKEPKDFDISTTVYPEFTPEVAAAVALDTRNFLEQQLSGALPTLRDVTEATSAVVAAPSAFLYGNAAGAGTVQLEPSQRLGIFSLPAVIASHSGPTTTRLVKRGVFFTRKVMCLPLGVPPQGVDLSVPEDAGDTERERIENVTKPAQCAGCHAFINPFGFMQESYDAIGRFRTDDGGQPIDSSIAVDFLDEGPFSASTPVEALRGFTRSLRFQQCFTRQLFRFYLGRDETSGDDPLLRQLFFEFAQNDSQSIVTLLRSLANSTSFHARKATP
ncbi:MAG TPA: DUF1588 domain-containing protein, partial [Polyangiaceae bacterium]